MKQPQALPEIAAFYDARTASVQYLVACPRTRRCAIIDPVLDYDEKSGSTATCSADAILAYAARNSYAIEWILDTHPHADHFSAAGYLKDRTGAPTAIGEKIVEVQKLWKDLYNIPDFPADGSQWDRLFTDGERFKIGELDVEVLFTPGHTLASIAYLVGGEAAFVHDTLFMPDGGTARADFPGGSARALAQHPAPLEPSRRNPDVHGPRLPAGGASAGLGEHSGPTKEGKHPPHESKHGRGVRGLARGPRSSAADAQADPSCASGKHPRRPPARACKRWPTLP